MLGISPFFLLFPSFLFFSSLDHSHRFFFFEGKKRALREERVKTIKTGNKRRRRKGRRGRRTSMNRGVVSLKQEISRLSFSFQPRCVNGRKVEECILLSRNHFVWFAESG